MEESLAPGRKFQKRILGNGPELADKLFIKISWYIIFIYYWTNFNNESNWLSIFMPSNTILYEILPKKNIKVLILMYALSGHKIYSDILKSELKIINNNDNYFFDTIEFAEKLLKHISYITYLFRSKYNNIL